MGNPFTAIKNTLKNIIVELLRALRNGVNAAARAVTDIIPDCCESCCLSLCKIDIPALCQECYDSLVDTVEDFFKEDLGKRHVPKVVTDMIELNDISPDEEINAPKSRGREKNPVQETMDEDSDDGED